MTLVAVACHPDRLEVVTDTLAEGRRFRDLVSIRGPKAVPLADLPAVAVGTGPTRVTSRWALHLSDMALLGLDVDELVDAADPAGCAAGDTVAMLYLAGRSPQDAAFGGWVWAPFTDWEPVKLNRLHLQPHPDGYARTDALLDRRKAWEQSRNPDAGDLPLPGGPVWPTPPTTIAGWRHLVDAARRTRGVTSPDNPLRNPFGGEVWRTTVTRDRITADLLDVLDEPGPANDDLAAMLTWTFHPTFQHAPCYCGSGRRQLDCHLAGLDGKPCVCGSDRPFGACCRAGDPDEPAFVEVVQVVDDHGRLDLLPVDRAADQRCPSCDGVDALHRFRTDVRGGIVMLAECIGCLHWWQPPFVTAGATV